MRGPEGGSSRYEFEDCALDMDRRELPDSVRVLAQQPAGS